MTGTGSTAAGTGLTAARTGSLVGSVVANKGWKTEHAYHLSHGPPPLPSAAPGSGQPSVHQGERQRSPNWVRPDRLGLPSISLMLSGSSSYGRPPPDLATVGGATTTSLRILRHDKKLTNKAATDCFAFLPD